MLRSTDWDRGRGRRVFVTAHSEHALKAFDLAAADYLLKPFSKERLHETLDKVRTRQEGQHVADLGALVEILSGERYPRRLSIPGRSKVLFVHVAAIDRIEADGNYVVIHVGERTHLLRAYLGEMGGRLDPADFVRVHRSHLVRRDRIHELRTGPSGAQSILLAGGVELPVGPKYASSLLG